MGKQFVLIHGAWHGGWCWDKVVQELEKAGHQAIGPTMPGHEPGADRSGIRLDDYIQAVIRELDGLQGPVVLAGHSSAGFIVQSVAARKPERIEQLIFNNAFILPHGKSQFDMVPPEIAQGMTQAAAASPDNCVPVMGDFVRETLMAGEDGTLVDELIERLVPQPIALFTTPVDLTGLALEQFKRTLIYCKNDLSLPPGAYIGMAQALGEFDLLELELGHEGLFTHPELIAQALLKAVD
jgi:pimeloyl-ACP methyl ester carboxylesterase